MMVLPLIFWDLVVEQGDRFPSKVLDRFAVSKSGAVADQYAM
jgi:hypothetical protein